MQLSDLVWIDSTGYHYDDFPTFLAFFTTQYQNIYGTDVDLSSSSQDGQYITAQAQAAYDSAAQGASTYSSFPPSTAQGVGLSRVVKINGLQRVNASYSTVDVLIGGTVGTTITNGVVQDTLNQLWNLPSSVVIPGGGTITVTATSQVIGAINADSGTVTIIYTPTAGWQTVTNAAGAAVGVGVEADSTLRTRQSVSTSLTAKTVFDGTIGAVANVPDVTAYQGYENDTGVTDSNGIPGHEISMVVEGGDATAIAQAILDNKGPGCGTYGTTSETVYDSRGIPNVINFYRPTTATIGVEITLTPLVGFTTSYIALIQNAVAAFINAVGIGAVNSNDQILLTKIYNAANLPGTPAGATFDITVLEINKNGGSFAAANIDILFNEIPFCDPAVDVAVTT